MPLLLPVWCNGVAHRKVVCGNSKQGISFLTDLPVFFLFVPQPLLLLQQWQAGVISALQERYDLASLDFVGASAGSLAATLAACGADMDLAMTLALNLCDENEVDCCCCSLLLRLPCSSVVATWVGRRHLNAAFGADTTAVDWNTRGTTSTVRKLSVLSSHSAL